jgi:cob(I)alamin adenosyltransferase
MKIPDLHLSDITYLENQIDEMNLVLPELKHFILPGGSPVVSFCHVSRCVCRRAERIIVHLKAESFVDEKVIVYLNRLSDYLFVLARKLCFDRNVPENQWFPRV